MQAIPPVDVHIENELHKGSNVKKDTKPSTVRDRRAPRMRTRVINNSKTIKTKNTFSPVSRIPKQVVVPKLVTPVRSRSSSPYRGPW